MSVPKTMKAVICTGTPNAEVKEVDVPAAKENEVVIKVHYASANPTDWKHKASLAPPGSILGCDLSGTIVKTSPSHPHLKEGQAVAAYVHGGKFDDRGAFAEYANVRGDFVIVLPDGAEGKGWGKDGGLEYSSSLGIPFVTASMALFYSQANDYPPAKKSGNDWFFIQGGSSAVGLYAIQLAKSIGFKVAVTCSPHSNDLVKSYGADFVADYHNPAQAVKAIKDASGGGVVGALEAIGGKDNAQLAIDTFGDNSGKVTTLLGVPEGLSGTDKVKVEGILMYTVGGYTFELFPGREIPANHEDEKWMKSYVPRIPKILAENGIKPNPPDVRQGIDSILPGLQELQDGKVSGKKLIFKIAQ